MTHSKTRREILQFFSSSALLAAFPQVQAKSSRKKQKKSSGTSHRTKVLPVKPLQPTNNDLLNLVDGLNYNVVIKWQDALNSKESFGYNCDFTATYAINEKECILWVNHEYIDKLFYDPALRMTTDRTDEQMNKERSALGGSLVHIEKRDGRWHFKKDSTFNRRIDGHTLIPFSGDYEVFNKKVVEGTFANCAGGYTPWNTFLSCEENYDDFVGEAEFTKGEWKFTPSKKIKWEKQGLDPRHYGWVVEVEPLTGKAVKHVSMGRMAHECATTTLASDKRCVVYMGDDHNDEHLYKFISTQPGDLSKGELYVASLEKRKWIKLNLENESIKGQFHSFVDLRVRTRDASKLVQATPLNRPEDIEIHPQTKEVFITLTNNKPKGDLHGAILKIKETGNDPLSETFEWQYLAQGGPQSKFSCPDNLVFDDSGHLWFTTDISEKNTHDSDYAFMGENSLFVMPLKGPEAGKAFRVASGPHGCELTGPSFSPDKKSLFLSVQHPGGAQFKPDGTPLSHWPDGGASWPKPSVVEIYGPVIEKPELLWS